MADHALVFTKKDALKDTRIYQVDEGTIFYHEYGSYPQKLYVKCAGSDVQAKLPPIDITVNGVHGNHLYFQTRDRIHRARFDEAKGIKNEKIHLGTLCSIVMDGKEYVYRLGEDPVRDGVEVDVSKNALNGLVLRDIHRHRIVYVSQNKDVIRPVLKDLSDNAIVVELSSDPAKTELFSRDASPLLYITNKDSGHLFTVDTNRRKCLRTLKIRNFCDVVGFHNGVMTIGSYDNGQYYMMTAELPNENFEKKSFYNGAEKTAVPESSCEERRKELVRKLEKKDRLNEELQETIVRTVNELLLCQSRFSDLTVEADRLRTANEEMKLSSARLLEENKQLKRENEWLSDALTRSEENAANAELRIVELSGEMELMRLPDVPDSAVDQPNLTSNIDRVEELT